ncbi:CMRF35-like molecule 9 isoform X4 [Manis pentadactyla]|uniref:CMRF35-like molecule 9 isoform X4 n=1 Tax=Manis pentadactyla TaxID=143292 RepID=UPI00255D0AC6|nr:CMRF35-like molecule 9 isoform X4 [Manis pentadactyla]
MQPLTLLWGCLLIPGCRALMGPKEIRGFEGDTVSLQCTYEEELRTYKKYWCRRRGFLFSRCSGAIYVEGDGQERTEGRVSVQDRPRELILKVTLRNLTLQDAGNYFCGVKKLGPDETFMVSLLIFPETKLASGRVARKGQAGGQLGTRNSEGPSGRPQGPQEGRPAISWNLSSVAPGPCCPLSPAPSFQPLATNSLQPKAKAWQTQPPGLRTSHPASPLDPTSAEDASVVSSSSSKSRVHVPMIRILAPVLVLLTLLLAAGLAALGSCVFRWRKEAQLATEAQRNKKVQLSHLCPSGHGTCWLGHPRAVVSLGASAEALAGPSLSSAQGLARGSGRWRSLAFPTAGPTGAARPGPGGALAPAPPSGALVPSSDQGGVAQTDGL